MSRKEKHVKKKKSKISIIIIIICIAAMIISGYNIFTWWHENKKNKEILDDISDKVIVQEVEDEEGTKEKYVVDFKGLKEKNPDTVAWIKIENTNIEYPVVKGKDNKYYLTKSFDKTNNSAGWVFMDFRNKADGTDKNTVLYGHNRKDRSMFGTLNSVFKEEWCNNEQNKYITYITEDEYSTYEIFSAYRIEEEDYYITTDFKNDAEYEQFLKKIKKRSYRDFQTDVGKEDSILTLSTCSNANYRVAVHAKKLLN